MTVGYSIFGMYKFLKFIPGMPAFQPPAAARNGHYSGRVPPIQFWLVTEFPGIRILRRPSFIAEVLYVALVSAVSVIGKLSSVTLFNP